MYMYIVHIYMYMYKDIYTVRWWSHYIYVKIDGYVYINVTFCRSHNAIFDIHVHKM